MENNELLYSLNSIRSMEVIDISTGAKLGYIRDFKVDIEEQKIISLLLPTISKSWFGKEDYIEIEWKNVVRAGRDVLLIDGINIENLNE